MYLDKFEGELNVVVVGATGGIGEAICKLFLNSEAIVSVYALSRSVSSLKHNKLHVLQIDFNDESSLEKAAQEIDKPIDILINATGLLHNGAGLQPEKTFRHMQVHNFVDNFMVNTIGPALVAKYFLPLMRTNAKTVFAALSARVGSINDNRLGGWHAYRASKAALNMLIKNLAIEISRSNKQAIIVGLHPGTVDTGLSKPFQSGVPENKLFTTKHAAQCLLNVINQLDADSSGKCFAWDNSEIPA